MQAYRRARGGPRCALPLLAAWCLLVASNNALAASPLERVPALAQTERAMAEASMPVQSAPVKQFEGRAEGPSPIIAIIIDDMGNTREWGQRALGLTAPVNLAFLPERPFTQELSTLSPDFGHENLLHAPMENQRDLPLGELALTMGMNELELAETLRRALVSIPHLAGLNNHMGSLLTTREPQMRAVMREVVRWPLYFVDSRTTAETVAGRVASEFGIPSLTRDVFLDNDRSPAAIHRQFQQLLAIARQHGTAIGIGHPYPETIHYLETVLPDLGQTGISQATVSAVWAARQQLPEAQKIRLKEWELHRRQDSLATVPAS